SSDDGTIPEQGGTVDEEQTKLQESPAEWEEEEEEEEVEFDLDAQIVEFRRQIEEDPENCIHHYNLGEALEESGAHEEAKEEFQLALQYDDQGQFGAVIHFGLGELFYKQLMQGTSSNVVKSSIGLLSAHKDKKSITEVLNEDYSQPIDEFEVAVKELPNLKADEDIVDYISKNAPLYISNTYYKWGSDLIDKARQLNEYGDEVKDVKQALKYLKKALNIDPNNSAAKLMVDYGKKMLTQGWQSYDDYGFQAKEIKGSG
ncbi:MAG: hypothetical protein ACE5EK_03685, partial [Nitrospinales bacterium]